MSKFRIIWNPYSGAGLGNKAYSTVTKILQEKNIPYSSVMSEYDGHPTKLVEESLKAGFDKFIIMGGDGSIREAAISLMHKDATLGIIPCGSGNDLVRALNIPADPAKALDVILEGNVRKMDCGTANGIPFFNIAGFGFDVDVLERDKEFRAMGFKGSFSYTLGLIRSLVRLTLRNTKITFPEGTLQRNVLLIAAGNGTHFGGGKNITPGADPFDGKFNVCVIHNLNHWNMLPTLAAFTSGKHIKKTKYVDYFQTTELTCECEPYSQIELDGEIMPGTPVTFKLVPKALNIFAPKA